MKTIFSLLLPMLVVGCASEGPPVSDTVIQTEKGPVEAWKATAPNAAIKSDRALTPEEVTQLARKASGLSLLRTRYVPSDTSVVSPELLDRVFAAWINDSSTTRPQATLVVEAVGSSLGNLLVERAGYQWRMIVDSYGTALGVTNPATKMTAFPLDSVAKRAARGESKFIARLYYAAKDIHPKGD